MYGGYFCNILCLSFIANTVFNTWKKDRDVRVISIGSTRIEAKQYGGILKAR